MPDYNTFMSRLIALAVVVCLVAAAAFAQTQPPASQSAPKSASPQGRTPNPAPEEAPDTQPAPPRSNQESSSKDTKIDLSPPPGESSEGLGPWEEPSTTGEFKPWDPMKAQKDVEIGDFYYKKENYRAAESRYREALYWQDNNAQATFRLATCLEKLTRPDEAKKYYESYLKILPHGPSAAEAQRALERLNSQPPPKSAAAKSAAAKSAAAKP
jgi:tetratricopeptide (TPR) repeat protein